ncbi:hypothetical protein LWM68_40755 [Niabella sp. W65]|nr:hypothetical protein [Niabella sp. W65]MCH7368504.1 hypothetical protein [Niabella sp. W65]ULT44094.1 hypothetical protein KRR40_12450 [Niabella sp. I65]
MERGKPGYRELFSRFGRSYIKLIDLSKDEIEEIARENGISGDDVMEAVNSSAGDLRRIDRMYIKKETKKNRERVNAKIKKMKG